MSRSGIFWNTYKRDILFAAACGIIFAVFSVYLLCMYREFSGDEFFSLEDTLGYVYTGQPLKWDFNANAVTDQYVGLPVDFFLLSIWVRLVGMNAFALKGLSAVYGLLAVFSLYYCVRKITGSSVWAALSSLLLAVNSLMLTMSTIVRGYTLLLLLNIWIFYFIYRALHYESTGEAKTRPGKFLQNWFDFDFRYGTAALLLVFLAYKIRVFEVFYLVGIGCYSLLRAVRTREKKFIALSGVFWGAVLLVVAAALLHLERLVPALGMITGQLHKYAAFGFRNGAYLADMAGACLIWPLTLTGIILAALGCLGRETAERDRDVLRYLASIVFCTLFLFLVVVDWQHNERYLFMTYPSLMTIVAGGFYLAGRRWQGAWQGFLYGIFLFGIALNGYRIGTAAAADNSGAHYAAAYEKVAEYLQGKPVFITGIYLRGYYARDILPDYIWRPMTSKSDEAGRNTDNLAELSEIGREHPQGILTCEDEKWYHFRNTFWLLLQMDSFERITGGETDETHVGNWAHHFCYPEEGGIPEDERVTTLFGYNYGGASRITETDGKTVVELEINGSAPQQTLLCIKVNQYDAGEKRQRYVQLVLEPNGRDRQYYRIVLENDNPPERSALDDSYYIYQNGKEPEAYEDCYNP